MRKYSKQREAVLEYLRSREDHPTAEMVFQAVRHSYPHISLGTVYRNLSLLTEDGVILRISCGDGAEHYDACVEPHYHFYCRKCGRVKDVRPKRPLALEEMAEMAAGDVVEGYQVLFYGVCEKCQMLLDSVEGVC